MEGGSNRDVSLQVTMSPGPASDQRGLHYLIIVGNNPVNFVDPFGLIPMPIPYLYPNSWGIPERPSPDYYRDLISILRNPSDIMDIAENIQAEEYPGITDPFQGDYRHCLAACISYRVYGPLGGLAVNIYWDWIHEEDNILDSLAGWLGAFIQGPKTHISCREACKGQVWRPHQEIGFVCGGIHF